MATIGQCSDCSYWSLPCMAWGRPYSIQTIHIQDVLSQVDNISTSISTSIPASIWSCPCIEVTTAQPEGDQHSCILIYEVPVQFLSSNNTNLNLNGVESCLVINLIQGYIIVIIVIWGWGVCWGRCRGSLWYVTYIVYIQIL